MWELKDSLLGDADAIFGADPWVHAVDVGQNDFGVEVGRNMHRGHFHLKVVITHQVPKYHLGKLRQRLTDWLNENWGGEGQSNGWNVSIRLLDSHASNYNNKEERYAKNDEVPDETDEELLRLSDDRDLIEIITRGMKHVRILEGNQQTPQSIAQNGRDYNHRGHKRV